jgi:hypothetical protein
VLEHALGRATVRLTSIIGGLPQIITTIVIVICVVAMPARDPDVPLSWPWSTPYNNTGEGFSAAAVTGDFHAHSWITACLARVAVPPC